MIHSGRDIQRGAEIELCRGDCTILARVVWREGGRAGLQSKDRVPIEEIIALRRSPSLQLTAPKGERRKRPRPEHRGRMRGRAIEFAGVAFVAMSLAGAALTMVEAAFARPIAAVQAALAD
jgi:hypothetical protein